MKIIKSAKKDFNQSPAPKPQSFSESVSNWWVERTQRHKWLFYTGMIFFAIFSVIVFLIPYLVQLVIADKNTK